MLSKFKNKLGTSEAANWQNIKNSQPQPKIYCFYKKSVLAVVQCSAVSLQFTANRSTVHDHLNTTKYLYKHILETA